MVNENLDNSGFFGSKRPEDFGLVFDSNRKAYSLNIAGQDPVVGIITTISFEPWFCRFNNNRDLEKGFSPHLKLMGLDYRYITRGQQTCSHHLFNSKKKWP